MNARPEDIKPEDAVNVEINGVSLQGRKGDMIIHVADDADIAIPRFCYHKKLPIAANCRMCLVEVENVPKPLPACATPISEGMKIFTRSDFAKNAQQAVMEFLLINHPLDCPICDQGGECELQDLAVGYGRGVSRFTERKRVVKDQNIGPLIATEMTRCIHCTRCVRTLETVGGEHELGGIGRGENTHIGTYIERSINSEMSGNVIDVCPVGALTAKPSRFSARAWELRSHDTISGHDCVGSNLSMHTYQNKVVRSLPRENESINEVWISDRDRFAYEGLNTKDRATEPMVKRNGNWHEVDWTSALDYAVDGLNGVKNSAGADKIGLLMSPNVTTEEAYLGQKLMRALGVDSIDHRIHQQDFSADDSDPVFPWLGQSIEDLESVDSCLIVGANIRQDQPIIGHRLRKAAMNGAYMMFVNPRDYEFKFPSFRTFPGDPQQMVHDLAGVAKALLEIDTEGLPDGLASLTDAIEITDRHRAVADKLKVGEQSAVLLGVNAISHPQYASMRALASYISRVTESALGFLTQGANSAGASLAGAVPHRSASGSPVETAGENAVSMIDAGMQALVIQGFEPEYDHISPSPMVRALKDAEMVIVMSPYVTDEMKEYADIILPVSPFTETSGTYVNAAGQWQSFSAVVPPLGSTRPAWKVWRVLGNLFELDGFDYNASTDVLNEVKAQCTANPDNAIQWHCPESLDERASGVFRMSDTPMYSVDSITRRAESLQQTAHAVTEAVYMNAAMLQKLGLAVNSRVIVTQGDDVSPMKALIDSNLPDGCVLIPNGGEASAKLGAPGHVVTIEQD